MRPAFLLMLATVTAATGCGSEPTDVPTPAPSPAQATLSLRNEAAAPLVYLAAGEGTLALLDIARTLPPGSYQDHLVEPGQTAEVKDVIGYDPALGVNFFIWRVDRSSGAAYLARQRLVTAAELAAAGGLVRITTFAP